MQHVISQTRHGLGNDKIRRSIQIRTGGFSRLEPTGRIWDLGNLPEVLIAFRDYNAFGSKDQTHSFGIFEVQGEAKAEEKQ